MTALRSALVASAAPERVGVVLGLEPAWPGALVAGPAFTVRGAPADNLALHQAVAAAPAGAVIVLAVGGERKVAHCGDVVALAAQARGLAGIVLDGAIRDRADIARLAFPVFHRGTSPRGPGKSVPGDLGAPVELDGVAIRTGDLVVADDDGLAVVRADDVDDVTARAAAIVERERGYELRIAAGETTLSILGLDG